MLTLFAGFVLNFSKIFCDWDFEASAAIFAAPRRFEDLGVSLGSVKKVSGREVLLSAMFRWNLCRGDGAGHIAIGI